MTSSSALVDRVRSRLVEQAGGSGRVPTASSVAAAVRAEGHVLGGRELLERVSAVGSELAGLGPLAPLLADPLVTDVLVNGPSQVWVERAGRLERTAVELRDEAAVRAMAQRLVACAGRRLDDASPYADVRLSDGLRLHAVLAPTSTSGTCLSLRVPARRPISLDDLVACETVTPGAAEVLRRIVRRRVSTLVTGGTGSGKTTVLGALLSLVPASERVVVVEDTAELQPVHPHVVALEARPPNVEGVGAVTVSDLVRQAMRMRPDRLVVGEARGPEVVDLLAALNTGHEGGFGTLHANSARDVPARLEALALPWGLPRAAVHAQIAAGVGAVVHLARGDDGSRRLVEVAVAARDPAGEVRMETAVDFVGSTARRGPGAGHLDVLLGA